GTIDNPMVIPALVTTLSAEKETFVKIACLDALRSHKAKSHEAIATISEQLKDEFWQTKTAAIQALRAAGLPDVRPAVPALIEAIQGAEGRLRSDLNDALIDFTT